MVLMNANGAAITGGLLFVASGLFFIGMSLARDQDFQVAGVIASIALAIFGGLMVIGAFFWTFQGRKAP